MARAYDLIVIGSGAGAAAAAYRCRQAGWRVAMIDSLPFGGTCALRGCDPKKVLVGAAELADWSRRMAAQGVTEALRIDWTALMRFKRSFTDSVSAQRERSLQAVGIDPLHGRARFLSRDTVALGDDELGANHFLLANGARPATLYISGEKYLTYSDQFLELGSLPARIVFVGGGYISFEFAHIAAQAGAQVQIVHRGARPLSGFDPDLVDVLLQKTRALGITVHLETALGAVKQDGNTLFAVVDHKGQSRYIEADLVVHGAGRVPDLDDMDLERGHVERERRGVMVDAYLRSVSNPKVYAAGDAAATGAQQLTPVAALESRVAAENLLGRRVMPDYRAIPTVVFTTPPLAAVGLGERAAGAQGLEFDTRFATTEDWYASRRIAERHTAFKVLTEKRSGRVLGAHLLGSHAEEIINLFALAIRHGLTATDLKRALYAYPTHASDIAYMV